MFRCSNQTLTTPFTLGHHYEKYMSSNKVALCATVIIARIAATAVIADKIVPAANFTTSMWWNCCLGKDDADPKRRLRRADRHRCGRLARALLLTTFINLLPWSIALAQTANRSPSNQVGLPQVLSPGMVDRAAPSTEKPGRGGTPSIGPQLGPPTAEDRRLEQRDKDVTQICKGC